MYRLKQVPEDFIVSEKLELELSEDGKYSYYLMKKRDYSTFDALDVISKRLKIPLKFINASGLKDRKAVTEQFISISRGPEKDFDLGDIQLKFLGKGKERLVVGGLEGNNFKIVVRNISYLPKNVDFVPNYFDKQRFGRDGDNHIIGRMLIKKDFKGVVENLIKKGNSMIEKYLDDNPNNNVGAIRKLPKKIIQIYISAYQSFLWNKAVESYITYNPKRDEEIPLPGFNLEVKGKIKEIYTKLFSDEGISLRDFILRQIPEVSTDGFPRKIFAEVENLDIGNLENDDINEKMKKVLLKFYLKKGSYATNVVKHMFK